MPNKRKSLETIILILLLMCLGCKGKGLQPSQTSSETNDSNIALLTQLTSTNEAERFKVIEEAKRQIERISVKDIDIVLTSLRQKNVSTLIFVLMEEQKDALYKLNIPAKRTIENSQGSFPNIAYYYARINPQKGLSELLHLYEEHAEERITICKAIGEISNQKTFNFLITRARKEKEENKEIIPLLAGLQAYEGIVNNREIGFFLERKLDREEIILLAKLKTQFALGDLFSFWKAGGQKKAYAIEHILNNPSTNFEALQSIVEYELENKRYENVIQLMMSDNMRRLEDKNIQNYRKKITDLIRERMI